MFVKVVFHIFILIGKTGTLVTETDFTIGRSLDVLIYGYGTEFDSHNASRHRVLDVSYGTANVVMQRAVFNGTVAVRSERTVFQYKVVCIAKRLLARDVTVHETEVSGVQAKVFAIQLRIPLVTYSPPKKAS